ncbi:outer membrane lipoprotein carrier protein LolA, partial [Kibdelosporangium lantanae]
MPQISADDLVQSVATAKVPALTGKISVTENLGLPMKLFPNGAGATVYADGNGHFRATMPSKASEKTFVYDGTTFYSWDSASKTVTESKPNKPVDKLPNGMDPATAG